MPTMVLNVEKMEEKSWENVSERRKKLMKNGIIRMQIS